MRKIKNGNVAKCSLKSPKNYKTPRKATGYKNHYQMKLNRLAKLKQTKGKCEVCGEGATMIHHIDESNDNHVISNLSVLCNTHHRLIHSVDEKRNNKTSKYIRKYGMTLTAMANKLGISMSRLSKDLIYKDKEAIILQKLNLIKKF